MIRSRFAAARRRRCRRRLRTAARRGAGGAQASASDSRRAGPHTADAAVPRRDSPSRCSTVPRATLARGGHAGPRLPDGTPARGVPRFPDGTPAPGSPVTAAAPLPHGTRPRSAAVDHPRVKPAAAGASPRCTPAVPRSAPPPGRGFPAAGGTAAAGPRREYVDAFGEDEDDVCAHSGRRRQPHGPYGPRRPAALRRPAPATDRDGRTGADAEATAFEGRARSKGGKGRTFTGIAAAAVTTVLAVVVAGQVADGHDDEAAAYGRSPPPSRPRDARDSASRGGRPADPAPGRPRSSRADVRRRRWPRRIRSARTLKATGKFEAVRGLDKAPGKGQKYTLPGGCREGARARRRTLRRGRPEDPERRPELGPRRCP